MQTAPHPSPHTFVGPLRGKTYSLREREVTSDMWYRTIRNCADKILQTAESPEELLGLIRRLSRQKRRLKLYCRPDHAHTREGVLLRTLGAALSSYTTAVSAHLRTLPLRNRFDPVLAMSEEQYHLAMLEIELVNRLCRSQFQNTPVRLAFLPHCLRDLSATCQAVHHDLDYVCRSCSTHCGINAVSTLLRRKRIKPFIWMNANLHALFRRVRSEGTRVGVLGIACIPELQRGMRLCRRYHLPVVGVPLDANRCRRWWGEFHWNTVNMEALARLVE